MSPTSYQTAPPRGGKTILATRGEEHQAGWPRFDSRPDGAGTGEGMETENREDLPRDDGAVEERGTGELGGAGVAGGAGAGTPGGPEGSPYEPGGGPTADEETGITGDPDER
jgi:hypothetical protein